MHSNLWIFRGSLPTLPEKGSIAPFCGKRYISTSGLQKVCFHYIIASSKDQRYIRTFKVFKGVYANFRVKRFLFIFYGWCTITNTMKLQHSGDVFMKLLPGKRMGFFGSQLLVLIQNEIFSVIKTNQKAVSL